MGDRKGKQVLDRLEEALKSKKRQCHRKETPFPRVVEDSSRAIGAPVGEAMEMTMETVSMAGSAVRASKEALKDPHRVVETINKGGVAPSWLWIWLQMASDVHSNNIEKVTALLVRRGKSSRRHHPKMVKASQRAMSGLKTPDEET